ncbi:MAG: hypothetical protein Salg2KO_10180 [Salibacteraceae bacterium]
MNIYSEVGETKNDPLPLYVDLKDVPGFKTDAFLYALEDTQRV